MLWKLKHKHLSNQPKNTYCCKRGHRYSHINHQHCSSPPSPQSTERKGGEKKKKKTKITKIEYVGREARDFFMNKMLLKEQEAGGGKDHHRAPCTDVVYLRGTKKFTTIKKL